VKLIRHLILIGLLVLAVAALAACSGGGERNLGNQVDNTYKPPVDGATSTGTKTTPTDTGLQGKDGAVIGDPGKKDGKTDPGKIKFNLIDSFTVDGTNWGNTHTAIATAAAATKLEAEVAHTIALGVKNGTAPYAVMWTLHTTNATIAKKTSAVDDTLAADGASSITLTPAKGSDFILLEADIWDSATPYNCVSLFVSLRTKEHVVVANTDPTALVLSLDGSKVKATWTDADAGETWKVTWNGGTPVDVTTAASSYDVVATTDGLVTVTCSVVDHVATTPLTGSISAFYNAAIGSNVVGLRLVPLTANGKVTVGDFVLAEFYVNAPTVGIGQFNVISLGTTAGAFEAAVSGTALGEDIVPTMMGARSATDPLFAGGLSAIVPKDLVGGKDLAFKGIWAGVTHKMVNNMPAVWDPATTPSFANVDAVDCFIPTDNAGAGAIGKFPSTKMDIYKEIGVNALGMTGSTTMSGWICSVILKAKTAGKATVGVICDAADGYTFYNDKDGNNINIKPTKFVEITVE